MADFMTSMPVRTDGAALDVNVVSTGGSSIDTPRSFNNRLIVEAYQKTGLQASVSNGFAFIQQKVTVKGLVVLMDAKLADGTYIHKGSIAYIKEESLHTQPWAQKILESDFIQGAFIIVDISNVEFIAPPGTPAA